MTVSTMMQQFNDSKPEQKAPSNSKKEEGTSTCFCTKCKNKILGEKFPSFRYKRDSVGGIEAITRSLKSRPCPICASIGSVVQIDHEIIDLIVNMNKKGFITEESCSGHRQFFSLKNNSETTSRISTFYIRFRLPKNSKSLDWLISNITADDFLVCNASFGYNITKEYKIIPTDKNLQCTIGAIDVPLDDINYHDKIEEYSLERNKIAREALERIIDKLPDIK